MHVTPKKRFFVDATVQRLGKWLRYLGVDAPYLPCGQSVPSDAYLLTKKRWVKNPENVVVVPHDTIRDQLAWFMRFFSDVVDDDKIGTRCMKCNHILQSVSKEEVKDFVPDYVYQVHGRFRRCPNCGRIYWKGSHPQRMQSFLEKLYAPSEETS